MSVAAADLYNSADPRAPFRRRMAALQNERQPYETDWITLTDFMQPQRARYLNDQGSPREVKSRRNDKIINSRATIAARTLMAGMHSGLTSQARPWFRLVTPDPTLLDDDEVRAWCDIVARRMLFVMAKSNFYQALQSTYRELGVYGTGSFFIDEDFNNVIRCYPFTIGEYWIAQDPTFRIDTMFRKMKKTTSQMVEEFGLKLVSQRVRTAWESQRYDELHDVVHSIQPNAVAMNDGYGIQRAKFTSVYYEDASDGDQLLRKKAYYEWPAPTGRWDVIGSDVYGFGPGIECIGDCIQLQFMEREKAKAMAKIITPPMTGGANFANSRIQNIPGGVTFGDANATQNALKPAYEVPPQVLVIERDMERVEGRIDTTFFADLFLMLAMSDRRQITAREVEERHEEKLLQLGPVLERLNNELLEPAINRIFAIMNRVGLIPPPPKALRGITLNIQYLSLLAQAQQIISMSGIDRMFTFVGRLAPLYPEVRHKLNAVEAVDVYAQSIGVDHRVIRSDQQVQKMIEADAQQQANAQQAAMVEPLSNAAKNLSETDTGNGNLLQAMTGRPAV